MSPKIVIAGLVESNIHGGGVALSAAGSVLLKCGLLCRDIHPKLELCYG
jgi:hypothetical protein